MATHPLEASKPDKPGSEDTDRPVAREQTEAQKVIGWRFKQLIFAGWGEIEADKISVRHQGPDAIDLHEAMELVAPTLPDKKPCPVDLAAQILL